MKKILLILIGLLLVTTVNAQTPGGVTVPQGGTGVTFIPSYSLISGGGAGALRIVGTTSPTVGWITATSTSQASIFPYASTTNLTVSNNLFIPVTPSIGFIRFGSHIGFSSNTANQGLTQQTDTGIYISSLFRNEVFTAPGTLAYIQGEGLNQSGGSMSPVKLYFNSRNNVAGSENGYFDFQTQDNGAALTSKMIVGNASSGGDTSSVTILGTGTGAASTAALNIADYTTQTKQLKLWYDATNDVGQIQPINTTGTVYKNLVLNSLGGNVGIGSSTPNAKLSIAGLTTSTGITFQTTNSSNSPLVTMLDSGKVGIGSSTPGSLLSVTGTVGGPLITLSSGNVNFGETLRFSADSVPAYWDTGIKSGSTPSYFINYTGTDFVTVTNAGNVGIGSTTPTGRFAINGSSSNTSANNTIIADSANRNRLLIQDNGITVHCAGTGGNSGFCTGPTGSAYTFVAPDTNGYTTGFATKSGSIKLMETGDGPESSSGLEFQTSGAGSGYGYKFYTNNSNDYLAIGTRYSSATWTNAFTLKAQTGKIGIATTSPVAMIDSYTTASTTNMLLESISGTGGCLTIKDVAGGGYTQITTQAGVISSKVATSLSTCN